MQFKDKLLAGLGLFVLAAIFIDINVEKTIFTGLISVSTFLFSAVTISAINDRQKRMASIRDQNSIARSMLIQLYFISSVWGTKQQEEMKKLIDQYLISIFMYRVEDQQLTDPYFAKLYETALKLDIKEPRNASAYGSLNVVFNQLIKARQDLLALIQDSLSHIELLISAFLGGIIISSLLVLNTGSLVSILIVSSLAGAVIFLLNLAFSLDNLDYRYEQRIVEPYQKTFEELGLLRYYPHEFIEDKRVSLVPNDKPYRVGTFNKPYPDTEGFTIKTIKPVQHTQDI